MTRSDPEIDERLAEIRSAINALTPGAERVRLEISLEELAASVREERRPKWLDRAKAIGPTLVALAAAWALIQGVTEYIRAAEERREAPFISALAKLADDASPAARAGALAVLVEYSEREDYAVPATDGAMSRAERVALVLALQAVDEPSPALRSLFTKGIAYDSVSMETGLVCCCSPTPASTLRWRRPGWRTAT
jgi:hypothetical protein